MTSHVLSDYFAKFFSRINPSATFTQQASSEHTSIRSLIENPFGPAAVLRPTTFLQGSYTQSTAIDTINDVDIVVLCQELSIGATSGFGGTTWSRNQIFDTIAEPLLRDGRYASKVRYNAQSMCIKVDLGIKVEILPVIFMKDNRDVSVEPFALYRPHLANWEDGFAQYHQQWLSYKNSQCENNFIPMVKVVKHLRDLWGAKAVSFHLECLLFQLPDSVFYGTPAFYIPIVLCEIAKLNVLARYIGGLNTPCGDRNVFSEAEWDFVAWANFFKFIEAWCGMAIDAIKSEDKGTAVEKWRLLLGPDYFPSYQ